MSARTMRVLSLAMTLLAVAGTAAAASDLWLHVRVDEAGGAKVRINLPVALLEKAIPMIPMEHMNGHHMHFGDANFDLADLREMWAEISQGPDMTFVTVEEDDESVRVWKEKGLLHVQVRENGGEETVDVKMPASVVDVLLSGEGDELNIRGAIEELVAKGGGDLVTVKDRDDGVRIWIDDVAEGEAP